ncbi:toxin-antitoxin system, antitoxin component, Xre family [Bordetella bronchiseptica E014]|nr:toxin-antitoxin system, antitoxin component, Xre family [Bordetella bronchiseptica E014]KDD96719.1 toxin-antitoxin system, antitoxin component, Xre family [Bordetella bronchiseptica SBL-F6116]
MLAVLGLEGDLNLLAADDRIGRKLQDLALEPPSGASRRKVPSSPAQNSEGSV